MAEPVYEGEYYESSVDEALVRQDFQMPVQMGSGMVQSKTPYVAAMQVLKPRNMDLVEKNILRQANLMGEKAAYGWGAGRGRVEGISIKMAMIILNSFGNMTVVAEPVQESPEAWVFTHYIVDLEAGTSAPRQWRESKRSVVEGKMDNERKDQVRFGRGQSKNIRNVIVNRTPHWLIQKILDQAKDGARNRLAEYIDKKGLAAAQTYAVEQLKRCGVSEAQIIEKMGKAEIKGLDLEDLVLLKCDIAAIESGEEHASSLFPTEKAATGAVVDLKDKLAAKVAGTQVTFTPQPVTTNKAVEAELKEMSNLKVRAGVDPFTWLVNDGKKDHFVRKDDDDNLLCNCSKPPIDGCVHVIATQRFETQS